MTDHIIDFLNCRYRDALSTTVLWKIISNRKQEKKHPEIRLVQFHNFIVIIYRLFPMSFKIKTTDRFKFRNM